jgi:hypothetical protein
MVSDQFGSELKLMGIYGSQNKRQFGDLIQIESSTFYSALTKSFIEAGAAGGEGGGR